MMTPIPIPRTAVLYLGVLCALSLVASVTRAADEDTGKPLPPLAVKEAVIRLGNPITLKIPGLADWADKHKDRDLKKLTLYLDGQPLDGLEPRIDLEQKTVQYELQRTDKTRQSWCKILGKELTWQRPVTVTIGFSDGLMLPAEATTELTIVQQGYTLWGSLAIYVFAIGAFLYLVVSSNVIRDAGPEPGGNSWKPFSLARTQMAVWFFLVLGSYLLIWVVTGDRDTLPTSVLALIGISAGTGLGAVMLDGSKRAAAGNELLSLQAEEKALQDRTGQLNALAAAASNDQKRELAEKTARLGQVQQQIKDLTSTVAAVSTKGFFTDILSDADGISFHRFQIAAWTVTLGLLFATSVWQGLTMPDFSNQLLGLMGISAGTYIGFKFPEKQT